MEEEYNMDTQDSVASDTNRNDGNDSDTVKSDYEFGYDESYEDEDGGFRGGPRGRGNFRGRGGRGMPPPGWMNGPPPMRFRGRGYGPGGPPMRGRGFFRGRGGPRFGPNGGPNFDNNWGPMGPPPPGMMGPPPFGPPPPGMMPPGGPMGPPPNMMGQPPPFGPPGMPPPNMPPPEIWVETKSDEGKSYYYHQRTRETTWTRPQESPTCKVITQAEMEAMVSAGQMPGMNQQTMGMNNPMGGPMGGPMGMMPNGMMGGMMPPGMGPQGGASTPNSAPPYMTHPPPWAKDGNNQMKMDQSDQSTMDMDELPPGESLQNNQMPNAIAPVTTSSSGPSMGANMGSGPPMGGPNMGPPPNMGGPGGGTWNPWGWGPPPMVAQPGFPGPDNNGQTPMGANQMSNSMSGDNESPIMLDGSTPPPKKEATVIPPELEAAAAEWTSHVAPDGRMYYHHAGRAHSVWIKPEPLQRLDELKAKIAVEKGERLENLNEPIILDGVIDVDEHADAAAAAEATVVEEKERTERERIDREKAEREREEREKAEKEKVEKEKAKPDKTRPVTSTPITGTPWCVVWTGDGRVFFYNPTARLSVWERPAQLLGRKDVDAAVAQPPHLVQQQQQQQQQKKETTPSKGSNGDLKRGIDSDSDSESDGPKRVKKVDLVGVTTKKAIDANADAAVEAEMLAARKRVVLPFEDRVASFLQLLRESDVSAFSPWEKELHKIVFDDRYLLLESKERRQVFNKYVRDRAEEERKEKRNKLLLKKQTFKLLMEEAKLHSKSSFTEFSTKYCRDERFRAIEKLRERETYFNEHIAELRKKEKEEKEKRREQAKQDFIQLLKDKNVDRHARWVEVKKKIDVDVRYKAVESSSLREDHFREYCKMIKDERKKDGKEKERERGSRKDKKDKDRDKEKEKEKEKDKDSKKEKKKDKGEQDSSLEEPKQESEPVEEEKKEDDEAKEREREARAQASIKEREKQVQKALATSLRDRDKEREYHKRDEAMQHFNALLADLVRNADLTWREAKKQLKKDHRYSLADDLSKEDKERLFNQHTTAVSLKRRDKLRSLLEELGVGCTAHWRDVRKLIAQQTAAPTYRNAAQMEREFRDFQRDKQIAAKTALRQLLQETRSITHRSLAATKESQAAMAQIHESLKIDARYSALEHIPDERDQIIMSYLEELEKKGPPPPPTATEPTRRAKP